MKVSMRVRVDRGTLDRIGPDTRRELSEVVRKTAFAIEALAKSLAPVDTGALRNSIQAIVTGELSAEVAVGVVYGIFVELGTVHMAAQPFLTPAFEALRDQFERDVAAALKRGLGA